MAHECTEGPELADDRRDPVNESGRVRGDGDGEKLISVALHWQIAATAGNHEQQNTMW